MRDHLRKIKQNVAKRAAAFSTYKATVDELDKQDAESLMGLKGAGVSNASCAGYLGAATKCVSISKEAHANMDKATIAHCGTMAKCVDGIAKVLNIDIRDRSNANADEAGGSSPTHDCESMEGTPVESGLKGATARDLQKMATVLPNSTPMSTPFGHAVQKVFGRRNPNEVNPHFGKSAGTVLVPIQGLHQHTRVLSEYDKRHQK